MKQELAAVFALMKLLVTKLHVQKTELFIEKLLVALKEKFQGHWYPDNPSKGQAYRSCIRVNLSNSQDPELLRACKESGVQFCELGLPPVLTLWVDPGEVACRIGEDNPCFSVARFPNNSKSGACADLMAVEDGSSSGSDSDSSSGYDSTDASLLPTSSRRCSDTNASAFRLPAWYAKALLPGKSHILPRAH